MIYRKDQRTVGIPGKIILDEGQLVGHIVIGVEILKRISTRFMDSRRSQMSLYIVYTLITRA